MAALVCILCSVSVELYRFGCVLIESGGSIDDCLNYLREKRETILSERYLESIDEFYQSSALCAAKGIKCINCKCTSNEMSYGKSFTNNEEFMEIEQAHEAFDFIGDYDHVSIGPMNSFEWFSIHSAVAIKSSGMEIFRINGKRDSMLEKMMENNGI